MLVRMMAARRLGGWALPGAPGLVGRDARSPALAGLGTLAAFRLRIRPVISWILGRPRSIPRVCRAASASGLPSSCFQVDRSGRLSTTIGSDASGRLAGPWSTAASLAASNAASWHGQKRTPSRLVPLDRAPLVCAHRVVRNETIRSGRRTMIPGSPAGSGEGASNGTVNASDALLVTAETVETLRRALRNRRAVGRRCGRRGAADVAGRAGLDGNCAAEAPGPPMRSPAGWSPAPNPGAGLRSVIGSGSAGPLSAVVGHPRLAADDPERDGEGRDHQWPDRQGPPHGGAARSPGRGRDVARCLAARGRWRRGWRSRVARMLRGTRMPPWPAIASVIQSDRVRAVRSVEIGLRAPGGGQPEEDRARRRPRPQPAGTRGRSKHRYRSAISAMCDRRPIGTAPGSTTLISGESGESRAKAAICATIEVGAEASKKVGSIELVEAGVQERDPEEEAQRKQRVRRDAARRQRAPLLDRECRRLLRDACDRRVGRRSRLLMTAPMMRAATTKALPVGSAARRSRRGGAAERRSYRACRPRRSA